MGTSQSSKGPGPNVPMVPPWVDSSPATGDSAGEDESQSDGDVDGADAAPETSPIAPNGRWASARSCLRDYANAGGTGAMRNALRHYVRRGYGGARTASRRMGGTAITAASLGNVLRGFAAGEVSTDGGLDKQLLSGRSTDEVMDAVVEAVRPVDGTQDAEASRAAIRDSLSELLTRFPDANLLELTPEQREFAIERFTAHDIFHRFDLDVGQAIRANAPNVATGLARLKQARDYVKQTVSASFRKLRDAGQSLTSGRIAEVVRDALHETFDVFEAYTE